jgi:cephalosporin-C deacetylase
MIGAQHILTIMRILIMKFLINYTNSFFIFFSKVGFCFVFIFSLHSSNTIAGQGQLKIDNGWVMATGDNPDWANADFDDSAWKSIRVGESWEKAGYIEYDGYAWYRINVSFPEKWSEIDKHGFLSLSLGFIDDADVTYFNGEKIGSSGSMPPEFSTAYYVERKYRIPTPLIHWDKPNVIAVRVYDDRRNGGFYKGPYVIKVPEIDDVFELNFKLKNSNGIYFAPDPLPVTLNIQNYSKTNYKITLLCTLKSDRLDKDIIFDTKGTSTNVAGKSNISETIKFNPPEPGFYKIISTLSNNKDKTVKKSMMFGYDPEKITTKITRENDFEKFWEKRKQELAQIDPAFKMTWSDRSTDDVNVFLVEMRSYGNVRVKGWYSVPKNNGPHAAILSVPGYTSTMWPYVNRTTVATFALNPRGHGNSKDDIDPKDTEYMFLGFDPEHPEKFIYVGAYLDCIRAMDFLVSRPEINKSRIGVEGGSQGGGLSFATAALDQRVKFCASDIPWMGDWIGYLEAADWPHENYPKLIKMHPGLTFSDINRILSYVDTMNLADRIRCPLLMSVGLQDAVCPPRNSFATYNQVRSDKEYRIYPFSGHGVWRKHNDVKNKWMAKILSIVELGL